MPHFDVAHIREQGQDMIIVPLGREFQHRTQAEQEDTLDALQSCARSARLAGTVVAVWDAGGGRMAFIAPQPWHPFFRSLDLNAVLRSINKRMRCGD